MKSSETQNRKCLFVLSIVIQLVIVIQNEAQAFLFQTRSKRRAAAASTLRRHGMPSILLHQRASRSENESVVQDASKCLERSLCVIADDNTKDTDLTEVGSKLARKMNLPSVPNLASVPCSYTHALLVIPYHYGDITDYAVAIQELENNDSGDKSRRRRPSKSKTKPFFVDFFPPSNSRLGKRFEGQSGTDLLLKAVSLNKCSKSVYDLTAGFGQDSILMLQGGASSVTMVERDPVVAALLSDALRRLNLIALNGDAVELQTQQRALDLARRLALEEGGNAVQVAMSIVDDPSAQRPDVCYVDPMFPTRRKTAAVKKNMQILHGLLGSQSKKDLQNEQEEQDLLDAALSLARERVVVKRPIHADYLGLTSIKPSYEIKGSINRWDVYVK